MNQMALGMIVGMSCMVASGRGEEVRPRPVLPGVQPGGAVKLPNQWSLRPAGSQIELGDFPVNVAIHPSGKWLAALHAGNGVHEIQVIALGKSPRVLGRTILRQTFQGLCFSPDGRTLYASGGEFEMVHAFPFAGGYLAKPRDIVLAKKKFVVSGLAVNGAGNRLFAAGVWGHAVAVVKLDEPGEPRHIALGDQSFPYGCLVDDARQKLYVSLWNRSAVAVVDLARMKVVGQWATEKHPTEMAIGHKGRILYVACSNSTRVSVIDLENGKGLETIGCALYPNAPAGNTPNSLCLTPDDQLLFVANADANNVAVFNVSEPGRSKPSGFIPVGMYPTAVRFNAYDKKLYIANGRGSSPKANVHGPNPTLRGRKTTEEYIARLYRGTLTVLDVPSEEKMVAYTKQAYECSPLRKDLGVSAPAAHDNPIPSRVGGISPIKHCIYIIRENRTYDQVFGDLKQGNGDPELCLFGETITPNAHRLARQFVLLDNFYCEGEVSAEGHEWSMGAYCTDFVKKFWPLTYRGSPTKKLNIYPAEGNFDAVARPAGGYIWDRCAEAGVSYRSYGEWVRNGKTAKDPATAQVKALEGHFDPWFRSFDLDYPDAKRADRFISELQKFEKKGEMPQFLIVRLPNDHTNGTSVGKLTPVALVADNDLALGRVVEAISRSRFWKDTAIFVVEDDAQNGPDHVDAHRTVALVISPYTKRAHVDSTMYSTSSMLRTMELILGLQPMSQFDAAARPMFNAFQAKADFAPYAHVVPQVDMKARNRKTAWGAKLSESFNFAREDAADDVLLNEVIWRSIKGADRPMPPPVRAAFFFPHVEEKK
jgi:DNA-binding beta-propeller fold protein YncE